MEKQSLLIGKKNDILDNKNRLDLIPVAPIEKIGEILTYGAQKYGPNNWMLLDDAINRYYGALLRHLFAWRNGEEFDSESGKRHVDHMACNAMFLQHLTLKQQNES